MGVLMSEVTTVAEESKVLVYEKLIFWKENIIKKMKWFRQMVLII